MNLKLLSIAFILSFILTPIMKRIALVLKVVDHPNERKIHNQPMPKLGSIAVYSGFILALFFSGAFTLFNQREFTVILLAASMLLIVGIFDDAGFLHPQIKLMVGMPVAGLILISFGLGLKIFPYAALNYFFTLFWIIGITAAYNLLDGMDGLSTGICIIASFFYFITGLVANDSLLIAISLPLVGSCLGFLVYNFHPAKIFLGDSGAIFLGFMLAAMGLRMGNNENLPAITRWMLPILILLVPIFDTSLITISRIKRGLIPFLHPGKDHSHHRLFNLGLGQRKTVLLIYLFGIGGGLVSLIIYHLSTLSAYLIFSFLLLSGSFLIYLFEKLPYQHQ